MKTKNPPRRTGPGASNSGPVRGKAAEPPRLQGVRVVLDTISSATGRTPRQSTAFCALGNFSKKSGPAAAGLLIVHFAAGQVPDRSQPPPPQRLRLLAPPPRGLRRRARLRPACKWLNPDSRTPTSPNTSHRLVPASPQYHTCSPLQVMQIEERRAGALTKGESKDD